MPKLRWVSCSVLALGAVPALASADSGSGHSDPIAPALLALGCVLLVAKLGGDVAVRLGQAAVLGELLTGVLLGNLDLVGIDWAEWIGTDSTVDIFARLGVILLLFEVGLESTVREMMSVGWSSFLVAVLGVAAPFALGFAAGHFLVPESSPYAHIFLGATLTATSVGITARVLKDLGQSQSDESRVILGAAVIDDVLGLVILAVVIGVIGAANAGREFSVLEMGRTLLSSLGFLVGALVVGSWLSPRAMTAAAKLRSPGVLLSLGLAFCFVLSWAANEIGLAPIVGAFAAGLVLEPAHYTDFATRGEKELEELVHPITDFLAPVFFVVTGMRTELRAFAELEVLALAAAITVAAIAGKQLCGLGVRGKGIDRLTIGIGMIPRGEVGLIFANIGLGLRIDGEPVVPSQTFSAVVVMIIVTTMITPPLLAFSIRRRSPTAQGA